MNTDSYQLDDISNRDSVEPSTTSTVTVPGWPGVAPPAQWFLARDDAKPAPDSAPDSAPAPAQAPSPSPSPSPSPAQVPSPWQRSQQVWAHAGIDWEQRPAPAPVPRPVQVPRPRQAPEPQPARAPGRHAKPASAPAEHPVRIPAPAPPMDAAPKITLPPAAAYAQLLGAPVRIAPRSRTATAAPRYEQGDDGPRTPAELFADVWPDDTLLLESPDFDRGRGRRAASVAAPALILVTVGAVALTVLTGHGPRFGQLSAAPGGQRAAGPTLTSQAFGTYQGQQPRGVFQQVNRIVAVGSTIVATAQESGAGLTRQQFFVSTDLGATWHLGQIQGNPSPGHTAALLAGGPGGWLAIGSQAIWTSPDGLTWTQAATHGITQNPGDRLSVVTSTAQGFLAGGSDAAGQGVIWTSRDGLTWRRVTAAGGGLAGPGEQVQNIAYATYHGNATLVTGQVSSHGRTYSGGWLSNDGGQTWTRVIIPGTDPISGVAWDTAGMLAVRGNQTFFSPNGLTWQRAGAIPGPGGLRVHVVKGDGYGFVVAGEDDGGHLVAYISTDNGATWRPTATLGNAAAEAVFGAAVAPDDTAIVAGATAGTPDGQQLVFAKATAAGVRPVQVPGAVIPQVAVNGLAEASGVQIAVGSADGYPAIWRNTDAGTWTLVTRAAQFHRPAPGGGSVSALTTVVHGPAGWLAAGPGLLMTSSDGETWRAIGGAAAAAGTPVAAAASQAGYVLVGNQAAASGSGSVPATWFSTDLSTWTPAKGLSGTSGTMLAVTAGPSGFTAVGSANGHPAAWTSLDARTWTLAGVPLPASAPPGGTLRQVAASAKGIVATGTTSNGAPFTVFSPFGPASWHLVPGGPSVPVTALTIGLAGFVAVGTAGPAGDQQILAWTSADGMSWKQTPIGPAGGTADVAALASNGPAITAIGLLQTPATQQVFTWTTRQSR
jgi:hypothetical protein